MNDDETPKPDGTSDDPTFAPSEMAPDAPSGPATGPASSQENDPAAPEAPAAEPDPAAVAGEDPQTPSTADPGADMARIEALEIELAETNDKLLRALAEAENVRRRAQRDKEDATKYAIKGFAEDMLRVADNMGRALSAIDADARAADANLENIAVGVEMVQKELLAAFERAGVKPIAAMGARFDPMLHEAMFEIPDPAQPAGTVAQVLEDGFTLHGRTLRAAKVGVTKGGPKAAAPAEEPDAPRRDGQQAYEQPADGATDAGRQLDEEL